MTTNTPNLHKKEIMINPEIYSVTLLRLSEDAVQAQRRGIITRLTKNKLLLTAESKEALDQMVFVASLDGWRRAKQ